MAVCTNAAQVLLRTLEFVSLLLGSGQDAYPRQELDSMW